MKETVLPSDSGVAAAAKRGKRPCDRVGHHEVLAVVLVLVQGKAGTHQVALAPRNRGGRGDVAKELRAERPHRRGWLGWCHRNLGYLAIAIQLVGMIMLDFDTVDAAFADRSRSGEDLLARTPHMPGCVCFRVASFPRITESPDEEQNAGALPSVAGAVGA